MLPGFTHHRPASEHDSAIAVMFQFVRDSAISLKAGSCVSWLTTALRRRDHQNWKTPMFRSRPDLDLASEYDAALREKTPLAGIVTLLACVLVIGGFLAWAALAKLDEVTRGDGKVIPSSKTQLVQSLEGGLIKEVLIKAGDRVSKGDILVRIDDTGFSSNFGEVTAKIISLSAKSTRLLHEAEGNLDAVPQFPADMQESAPALVANETSLYKERQKSLLTQLRVLEERVEQRALELKEAQASMDKSREYLALANQEMKLKKPLAARGIVSKTDIIRLQRDIADAEGQIAVLRETLPKIESSIRESKALIAEQQQKFREEARAELSLVEAERTVAEQSVKAAKDRVVRADIRSPVEGIVNKVNANTIGGVVQAGQTIMEIVPIEDSLFVEARIKPADIAFVHPNQNAVVKLTAYDFSVYGGLEGKVELISADSVYDEQLRESFYLVTVKTLENRLKVGKEDLPIIPGMVASVDILTGKKSVLDYLLKPINKARNEAMRER
jgi:membrane fusion protein, adhesin transport system